MIAWKKWISHSLVFSLFTALTAVALTYSPVAAEIDCEIRCRNFMLCLDQEDGCAVHSGFPEQFCTGTFAPGDCTLHWCESDCEPN